MKVAYYYNQKRLPKGHSKTNPYGPSLVDALEKLGYEFEFSERFDTEWLIQRRKDIHILHWNWPSYQYKRAREGNSLWEITQLWLTFIFRLVLARLLGYKLVWTMHNLYPHDPRYKLLDHLARLALCRLCNSVIVHCKYARNLAAQCFRRKRGVYMIPHGHFIDVYPNQTSAVQAREWLGIPKSNFVYLFFGSIQQYKGLDDLIGSFHNMAGDDMNLVIVGAAISSYAAQVVSVAETDKRIIVRFSPRTPSEELQYYFNAADVVVLPFTAMLTSGSVVLALSWKKPVIVPALGCLPELMTKDMGIMYDPQDPEALGKALRDVKKSDCRRLGENAYRKMLTYNWAAIARSTHRAYQGI